MPVSFNVNGKDISLDIDPQTSLLEVLRNDLGLNGPKFGCGLAQCGACAVLINGQAARSCVTPVSAVSGLKITTLEGLGSVSKPHIVQTAFIEMQAMQCGYCSNGMIISAAALLADNPRPERKDITDALEGNLCRCGAHTRIIRAIERAAELLPEPES